MNPASSVIWVPLIAVILFALMAVGALVIIAVMLASERTRRVGLAILAVLGVGLGLMVLAGFAVFAVRSTAHRETVLQERPRELAEAIPYGSGEMPYDIEVSGSADDENNGEKDKEATDGDVPDRGGTGDVPEKQNDREESQPQQARSAGPPAATPPRPRPAWVEKTPKRVGDVYQVAVASDPYSTKRECDRQIDRLITIATAEYLDDLLGEQRFARNDIQVESQQYYYWAASHLSRLGVTPHFIRQNICADEFDEIVASSVGPMHKVHVLMKFDKDVEIALRRRWKESQVEERLLAVATGAFVLLVLVGLVFGYLKFDTATKGFYTRRLQLAAIVVTIIIIAAVIAVLA